MNRKEFYKQQKELLFVEKLYEKILHELYQELNKLLNSNLSKRGWRILIGPWLNRFIAVSVDRIRGKKLSNNKKNNLKNLICSDLSEFTLNTQDQNWNQYFISRLKNAKKRKANNLKHKLNFWQIHHNYNLKIKLKNFLLYFLVKIFCRFNNFLFYKPYLGKSFKIFKFFWNLKEVPFFYNLYKEKNYKFEFDNKLRKQININSDYLSKEEKIIKSVLIECIPTFYIEGFNILLKELEKSVFPKEKKVIFTGSLLKDNLFKFWVAHNIDIGGKLVFKQHGSNYGQLRYLDQEKHEIKISDKFFTNGWRGNEKKIIPSCNFQAYGRKKIKRKLNDKILIVSGDLRKFKTNNIIFDKNYKLEIKLIENLLSKINYKIRKNISYKSHPLDSKNNYYKEKQLNKKFKDIKFLKKNISLINIYKNFNLVIFLYNSTDFLHLVDNKIPSIFLINKNFLEFLNEESKKDFQKLKKGKIFFDDINILSEHINKKIDFSNWWESSNALNIRKKFRDKYSNTSDENFNNSLKILKELRNS